MSEPRRQPASQQQQPVVDGSGDPAGNDLARLLRAAAAGDEEAWRKIVELYARRVYALVKSRLVHRMGGAPVRQSRESGPWARGHDVAEEVTQSVFVTVATKLSSGEYTEQGRFESWLFRVAMNRIRDEARRVRRQAAPTDPETLDSIGGAAGSAADEERAEGDQFTALRGALAELSESDREVIELRHHAGLSFKQMADVLSEPLGTLLARHHRALRKLKEIMTGESGTPAHVAGDTP